MAENIDKDIKYNHFRFCVLPEDKSGRGPRTFIIKHHLYLKKFFTLMMGMLLYDM